MTMARCNYCNEEDHPENMSFDGTMYFHKFDCLKAESSMKAITLTQPWATLVAIGAKKIETRSWSTAYRGPLAIHAAKGFPNTARDICFQEPFSKHIGNYKRLPLGSIVATCELVSVCEINAFQKLSCKWCVETEWGLLEFELTEEERSFGDYTSGRYAWLLHNVKPLAEPIPAKGALGLWEFNGAIRPV
jgi:hypothetical protein